MPNFPPSKWRINSNCSEYVIKSSIIPTGVFIYLICKGYRNRSSRRRVVYIEEGETPGQTPHVPSVKREWKGVLRISATFYSTRTTEKMRACMHEGFGDILGSGTWLGTDVTKSWTKWSRIDWFIPISSFSSNTLPGESRDSFRTWSVTQIPSGRVFWQARQAPPPRRVQPFHLQFSPL